MAVHFGTDGIRGRADVEITVELARRLGVAVADVFDAPVVVGADTRESSNSLAEALLGGLVSRGATATNLGVFTTPGVATIAESRGAVGVVVSASHNPYYDNGLKVLGPGGRKLDVATEAALSRALEAAGTEGVASASGPTNKVIFPVDERASDEYLGRLRRVMPADVTGLKLVIDTAHGAASSFAEDLFVATGAEVTVIANEPDGRNINDHCGSTHPDALVAEVLARGADLGLALDGDADRLIAVDERGRVRDGDDLMVLFGLDRHERGLLEGGVVVTVMSNLGLRRAFESHGLELRETAVGDRHVALELDAQGWNFGGEQSGHLIFRDLAPTGDGMLSGLMLAELVARRGALSQLCDATWTRVPQRLVNVETESFDEVSTRALYDELRKRLGVNPEDARLEIRPSGTEPVVRVMVEATSAALVNEFSQTLLDRSSKGSRGIPQ